MYQEIWHDQSDRNTDKKILEKCGRKNKGHKCAGKQKKRDNVREVGKNLWGKKKGIYGIALQHLEI